MLIYNKKALKHHRHILLKVRKIIGNFEIPFYLQFFQIQFV